MAPRAMTNSEIAGFMLRHPIEADYIAATKIAISTGVYNWVDSWPGVIPPWGTQVNDSTYGVVTIFFGQGDGVLHMTADSPVLADINKPAYVPPPQICKRRCASANGAQAPAR